MTPPIPRYASLSRAPGLPIDRRDRTGWASLGDAHPRLTLYIAFDITFRVIPVESWYPTDRTISLDRSAATHAANTREEIPSTNCIQKSLPPSTYAHAHARHTRDKETRECEKKENVVYTHVVSVRFEVCLSHLSESLRKIVDRTTEYISARRDGTLTDEGYLFRTRVRSWQKALAGAARRIRCHSHPRMLLHSRSSCPLGGARSLPPLPNPSTLSPYLALRSPRSPRHAISLPISLLSAACFLLCLNALSFSSSVSRPLPPPPPPLFPLSARETRVARRRSRTYTCTYTPPTSGEARCVQTRATRRTRLIHKPINAANKLENRLGARQSASDATRRSRSPIDRTFRGTCKIGDSDVLCEIAAVSTSRLNTLARVVLAIVSVVLFWENLSIGTEFWKGEVKDSNFPA